MLSHHACALLMAALVLVAPPGASAHEGHDHGAPPVVATTAVPRAEATSDAFELVAVARGGELTLYLDAFATNTPVPNAAIDLETPQGSVAATPAPDGSYRVAAPWSTTPGRYDLIATVTTAAVTDILTMTLDIPAPAGTVASGLAGAAATLGLRNLHVAANSTVVLGLVLAFAAGLAGGMVLGRRRRVSAAVLAALATLLSAESVRSHEGEDHSHPAPTAAPAAATLSPSATSRDVAHALSDGSIFVPKATQRILAIRTAMPEAATHRRIVELPGRIIPDPHASGYVQAAISGRLSPPESGFPRLGSRVSKGDVLAYVTPPLQAIDVSDLRQRQGELDQQIAIVERRLTRFETLAPSGAVARSQLEETRLELQGLRDRRASLDRVRREPEALVAPVDGVVAEGTPVAGQIAQTNVVIFHIVDPARLWVEALSYEAWSGVPHATTSIGGQPVKLAFRGAGLADRSQSVPVHFAIEDAASAPGLRIGQFVTVLAETADEQRGVAVPRASLVRTTSGQEAVFEHVSAERFTSRPVRVEPLDGSRVLITQGLEPRRRLVVQGAELLDHIR